MHRPIEVESAFFLEDHRRRGRGDHLGERRQIEQGGGVYGGIAGIAVGAAETFQVYEATMPADGEGRTGGDAPGNRRGHDGIESLVEPGSKPVMVELPEESGLKPIPVFACEPKIGAPA